MFGAVLRGGNDWITACRNGLIDASTVSTEDKQIPGNSLPLGALSRSAATSEAEMQCSDFQRRSISITSAGSVKISPW